ncbi:MAG: hypothetical protein ACJARS_003091 [bacterium]
MLIDTACDYKRQLSKKGPVLVGHVGANGPLGESANTVRNALAFLKRDFTSMKWR